MSIKSVVSGWFRPSPALTKEERKRAKAMILGAGAGSACRVEDGVIKVEVSDGEQQGK